jgi:hypothetical protein
MKNLQIEDTITLKNGDEEKTYKVIGRNNDVQNPPEYTFENTETGEKHGPVLWNWLEE